jgi:hypothetical protein
MNFSPDRPIQHLKDDLLNRRAFVNSVAAAIRRCKGSGSLIIGICCAILLLRMFVATFAWAEEQKNEYRPCNSGPDLLRQTDEWERKNSKKAVITFNDQEMEPEAAAEILISDCSKDLSKMSFMAAREERSIWKSVVNGWRENLEFMKWWLQNRRSKAQPSTLPN